MLHTKPCVQDSFDMAGSIFHGLGDPPRTTVSQEDSLVQRQEMAAGRISAEGALLGECYSCMLTKIIVHPA